MLNLAATVQGSALGSCRPGAVAAHARLSDSFGGTNSGFGSADGCGVGGGGSQSVGVYLEIGLDGFFDHTGHLIGDSAQKQGLFQHAEVDHVPVEKVISQGHGTPQSLACHSQVLDPPADHSRPGTNRERALHHLAFGFPGQLGVKIAHGCAGVDQQAYDFHKAIFDAIAAHDPDGAEAAMRQHLDTVVAVFWKMNKREGSSSV